VQSGSTGVRRRALLRAAALLPLGTLGGCIVAPYGTYHRPSADQPGARLVRGWCQGRAGPETGIDLEFAGLRLHARTEPVRVGTPTVLWLSAVLTVPAGAALHWPAAPRLLADGRTMPVEPTVSARRAHDVAAGQWLEADRLRPGRGAVDPASPFGALALRLAPSGPAASRITVDGLSLESEGGRFVLPATTMALPGGRSTPHTYRSAEEQAAARARAQACPRDTPDRACDNILDFAEISHSGQDAGWRWRGRWYQFPRGNGPGQLEGEMTLASLQHRRWRFGDDAFRVRDDGGAPPRPLRIAHASVTFEDAVEPGAVVAPSAVETRVHVQARLPEGAPSFELRLPSLVVNGARVEPPPLRFERRSFDGGIEPFNC